jgi:superfamily I DNA/RNA helicase
MVYSKNVEFLDTLNTKQCQVAEAADGPLAVIAGPGTGKTKTLTARIAYLLKTGRATNGQLLALTFTNKAAGEMRQRLATLLHGKHLPQVTTFHAFCAGVLKNQGHAISQFVTEPEKLAIIKELPKPDALRDLNVRELSLLMSRYKNAIDVSEFDPGIARLASRYDEKLKTYELADFDNLLTQTHSLLLNNKEVKQHLSARYQYVLVDEFQDTNELQYELLKCIANTANVLVIGDPLQSIYGFRGASSSIFRRFLKDFPQAKTVTLSTNYRSHQTIVSLAKAIFPNELHLEAHSQAPGDVQITKTLNEYSEANYIVNTIQTRLGGTDLLIAHNNNDEQVQHFSDFAVLYRTHRAAHAVARAFADSGIPYQIAGEQSPYEHPVIKTIIVLLGFMVRQQQPDQRELKTLSLLAFDDIDALLAQCRELIIGKKPSEVVEILIEQFDLQAASQKAEAPLRQFMNLLVSFDQATLAECVNSLQKLQQSDCYDPAADAVTLLTIHGAKGLEFPHVFLCAAEEGILPHGRKGTDITEEQRLFYVAVTRAKHQLDITYAVNRARQPVKSSRFLQLPNFTHRDDPDFAVQQKRIAKQRHKRAQTTLF